MEILIKKSELLNALSKVQGIVEKKNTVPSNDFRLFFANTRGEVCEGTGTNVFVVLDGAIRTPPLSSGCLAGITRELVLENLDVIEQPMPLSVLQDANEVFLTSSTRDVQALECIDDRALDVGPLTRDAVAALASVMATDLDP